MGRPPEGIRARDTVTGIRLTPEERRQLDIQRWKRGNLSRAAYVRWLIEVDGDELKREARGET